MSQSKKSQPSAGWNDSGLGKLVINLGGWAWLIGVVSGVIYLIWGIYILVVLGALAAYGYYYTSGVGIWYLISGIIEIAVSLIIVLPRISRPCLKKDWNRLYNDVLKLGSVRLPWMLIWGIILEVFGYGWGGAGVIIPALILLFAGPQEYKWTE